MSRLVWYASQRLASIKGPPSLGLKLIHKLLNHYIVIAFLFVCSVRKY